MKTLFRFSPFLVVLAAACAPVSRTESTVELELPVAMAANVAPRVKFANARSAAIATISSDRAESAAAIAHLRSLGAGGMDALREAFDDERLARLGEGAAKYDRATSDRILAAMDKVSGQRDGWASGLYWHTDLATALAAAKDSGKPVLNLWLLGRLDDEFC
jgi:hypothetical protein